MLLATKQAIEQRLDLLCLHSYSSILFPCQRSLSFVLFMILICFTALCASVSWFSSRAQWIGFEFFHVRFDLYLLNVHSLIRQWWALPHWPLQLQCLLLATRVSTARAHLLEVDKFLLSFLAGWLWTVIFCEILKHGEFLRHLQILEIGCGWGLASLAVGQGFLVEGELLLFGR